MMRHDEVPTDNPDVSGEFEFDESSGISKDDQKEILAEIDHIVTDNRISVTPEVLKIKALKKGSLFPTLVNVFSFVILAAGILTLTLLFKRSEGMILEEAGVLSSAEGKLLQELKKESEKALLEKNQEIALIQSQLQDLDRERQDLESNMNAKIAEREEELRTTLQEELASERERLRQQGISEEDIEKRLSDLEAEKRTEYDQRLAAFRSEAEAERQRIENNLKALQEEYNKSLEKTNQERSKILADSKKREEELQSKLEEKTRALEEQRTESERQLQRIAEQKEREEIVNTHLIGFYNTVRDNIRDKSFEQALRNLESIKDYLNEEGVVTLPGIQRRREVEFFVVDSLKRLVENEMSKERVDTTNLIASANLITNLKEKVLKADSLYRAGDREQAEKLYREALQMIPEVDRSHNYFISKSQREEELRKNLLDTYLAKAEEAFNQGLYAESLQNYSKALEYLPEEPSTVESMVIRIRQSGFELGTRQIQRVDTERAGDPLERANELMEQKRYNDAIGAYLDLINRYPRSSQVKSALDGVKKAVAAKNAQSQDGITQMQVKLDERLQEIETLKREKAERDTKIAELEASMLRLQEVREQEKKSSDQRISELEAAITNLEAQIAQRGTSSDKSLAQLQKTLESKESELRALSQEREKLSRDNVSLKKEVELLKNQIEQLKKERKVTVTSAAAGTSEGTPEETEVSLDELERLAKIEKDFRDIRGKYVYYADKEDSVLNNQGDDGLLETKLYLDEFLTYESMESTFPGLWRRIKKYDQAFEKEGRKAALQDVIDIVYDLSTVVGDTQRIALLDEEIVRNSHSPLTRELLEEIRGLIQR
jgi:hypothetical protein